MLLAMGLVTLTACESADQIGQGPITISPGLHAAIEQYKDQRNPRYFAVSENGNASAAATCPFVGGCRNITADEVINVCEERSGGVPCKIFARGTKVIWNGDVTYQ